MSEKKPVTPLPKLQLATLLLIQLAEPVSATVIHPFIAELINSVGVTGGDAKKVGYYAGLVQSLFFVTEFIFVLQWGRLSDRIGRRPVLLCGVFGLAISSTCFGLATSFIGLVISRALAGALCGNIGVAKSMMGEITDETNIALGFSFLPIVWAVGSTIGPMFGGYLSRPAETHPDLFSSSFWKVHPYFLPCATAAGLALTSFVVAFFFLEETLPATKETNNGYQPLSQDDAYELSPISPQSSAPRHQKALGSLLTRAVYISILNYGTLALVDMAITTLMPVMFAAPINSGGLGLSPKTIGSCLAAFGFTNGFVQVFAFPRLHNKWGTKPLNIIANVAAIPVILAFPLMNSLAVSAGNYVSTRVWMTLAAQFLMLISFNMAFSCAFIFINSSVVDRHSLGATHGLAQMTASFMRAMAPAGATTLFAVSNEHNLLGGNLVYLVLIAAACAAVGVTCMIPHGGWVKAQERGHPV